MRGPTQGHAIYVQRQAVRHRERPCRQCDRAAWRRLDQRRLKAQGEVVSDVDGDGDLDILCCEERDQLGVFWYENPYGQ